MGGDDNGLGDRFPPWFEGEHGQVKDGLDGTMVETSTLCPEVNF